MGEPVAEAEREELERLRTADERRRAIDRKIARGALLVAAVVLGALVFVLLVWPPEDNDYGRVGVIRQLGVGAFYSCFVGIFTIFAWAATSERWSIGIVAALAPALAMGLWGATKLDDHRAQDLAGARFASYTERVPPGELGEPFIAERHSRYITMCATLGKQAVGGGPYFCLEIIAVRRGPIAGGFKTKYIESLDDVAPGNNSYAPYDCFGEAIVCQK